MKYIELKVQREYHDNGQLCRETYKLLNGKLHNPDGPAIRRWNKEGALIEESYFINNKCHKEDGPAYRLWDRNLIVMIIEQYWINGKQLTKEEFETRTRSCGGKVIEIDGKKYKLTEVN